MKKKTIIRITALLIAVALLLSICVPLMSVFSASDTITISTEQEFAEFAKKCKTNTWSQGKTFNLTADIDLSKIDFTYIPTFGGRFNGNGYTISGVNMKNTGSYIGLFRYIQSGGIVENLNVSGEIAPDGTKKNIGGIVGESSGTLKNCTFNGSVLGDASVGGICGYITESGKISNCKFSGSVTGKSYTGGIAGQNYGIIEFCENNGNINTTNTEEEKSLMDTMQDKNIDTSSIRTTETIDTATDTGGICGYSKGKIISSKNNGDVGYESIGYNTGGICGRQSGYIQKCENYGTINGRKDIGGIVGQAEPYVLLEYTKDILTKVDDVLSRIKNIFDSGMFSEDKALEDNFEKIENKMTEVKDKAEPLSDDIEQYSDDLKESIDTISDTLHKAIDDSSDVFDGMSAATDKMSDGILYFSDSGDYMKNIIDDIETAADSLDDFKNDFDDDELKDSLDHMGDQLDSAASYLQKVSHRLSSAFDELEDCASSLNRGSKKIKISIGNLSKALAEKKNIEANFKEIWSNLCELKDSFVKTGNALEDISNILKELHEKGYIKQDISATIENAKLLAKCYKDIANAISGIGDGVLMLTEDFDIYSVNSALKMFSRSFDALSDAFGSMRRAGNNLEDALDELDGILDKADKTIDNISDEVENVPDEAYDMITTLQDGLDIISDAVDDLTNSIDKLSDIVEEVSNEDIEIPDPSDALGNDFDNFLDSFEAMTDEFSSLKDILKDKKNGLSDDFDSLRDELDTLSDILSDTRDEHKDADKDDLIEDISDKDTVRDTRGKVDTSVNFGKVFGDVNTGGIVGSMAVEFDFDPEDDIKNSGDKSLDFTYRTKCVIRRCRNEAQITAKKDYVGGITGRMDLGSILSCENYGFITSDDGDYIGGIAGLSDTIIRNSASKCELSGTDYIGGITGKGDTISNCYAMVHVSEFGECAGSISGYAELSELKNNYFVSDILGGIDDINYTGLAGETDAVSFSNFVQSTFGTRVKFTLTFVADDKEIAKVPFEYKNPIPAENIPKVPEKKGYYGKWEDYDFNNPCYDTVINAEYTQNIELLESDLKRDNGKSIVLICGSFNDAVNVKTNKTDTAPDKIKAKQFLDGYMVDINGAYNEKYTIRYMPVSEMDKVDLYVECNGKAAKVPTKSFGSYLEFETPNSSFLLYEARKDHTGAIILSILLSGVCVAGIVLVVTIKKRKKRANTINTV